MDRRLRLLLAVAVLALAGCAASPEMSPETSEAAATLSPASAPLPTAVAEPTTGSTEAPRSPAPPDPILLGSAVRVAVPELNLRKEPNVAASIVDLLTPENVLRLNDGPEEADGYTWYHGVETSYGPLSEIPGDAAGENPSGWLAVAKGATSYVTRLPPRCPTTVDLVNVAAQLPAERLECFGSDPIVVEGVFGCGECGGTYTGVFEPAWLAAPMHGDILSVAVNDGRQLFLRFSPDGPPMPPGGSILRVTGHFDDPAAQTCRFAYGPFEYGPPEASPVPIDPAISILQCRQEFVVDIFEVLGVDPSFGVHP